MTALSVLFERFLKEKRYLQNVTPKTLDWYASASVAFNRAVSASEPAHLTKALLSEFVVASRDRGLSPVTVSTWSKVLNAFLGWLHAEGHVPAILTIASLKTEKRVLALVTTEQLKRLLAFKPKTIDSWRSYALACTLLGTGVCGMRLCRNSGSGCLRFVRFAGVMLCCGSGPYERS